MPALNIARRVEERFIPTEGRHRFQTRVFCWNAGVSVPFPVLRKKKFTLIGRTLRTTGFRVIIVSYASTWTYTHCYGQDHLPLQTFPYCTEFKRQPYVKHFTRHTACDDWDPGSLTAFWRTRWFVIWYLFRHHTISMWTVLIWQCQNIIEEARHPVKKKTVTISESMLCQGYLKNRIC